MIHGMIRNLVSGGVPLLDQREIRVEGLGEPRCFDGASIRISVRRHERGCDGNSGCLDSIVEGQGEELWNRLGIQALGRVDRGADASREDARSRVTSSSLGACEACEQESRHGSGKGDCREAHLCVTWMMRNVCATSDLQIEERESVSLSCFVSLPISYSCCCSSSSLSKGAPGDKIHDKCVLFNATG